MSGLLAKWLSLHGCPNAATPATAATPSPKPAQTLAEMGSNPSATLCYPEPESAEGSNGVATTLLPKNASKQAASAAEVAKVAKVAGYRHPHPKMAPLEGSTVARIVTAAAERATRQPETDPAAWRGEYEEPEPRMAVRFWRHGEVFDPPSSALVPRGPLFDAADWLDDHGHGPVAVIEEQR